MANHNNLMKKTSLSPSEEGSFPSTMPGSSRVFSNWFMHMHPAEVPKEIVHPKYALGPGLITLYLFVILGFTG